MKNKGHILILLVFLILVGMIVSPASAYTEVGSTTVTSKTSLLNVSASIYMNGTSDWSQVTHLTWEGADSFGGTWSYPNQVICKDTGDTQVGTAAISVSGTTITIETVFTGAPQNGKNYIWSACANGNENSMYPFKQKTSSPSTEYSSQPYGFSFAYTGGTYPYNGVYKAFTGSSVIAPVASFTCSPVHQYPDTDIVCTDTSTNTPTNWYWMLGYPAIGLEDWQTSTSKNFTWQSHYQGLFDVRLYANNSAGGSWYNRSEYVEISQNASPITPETPIPAGYIRSSAQCVDSQTSGTIRSCEISLYDKEAAVWSNGSWYGTYYIDTLPAHHIDAYGVATGYTSTSRLNLPASGTIMYELLMVPGYVPPAAEEHVWLYVIVNDLNTGAPLPNTQVQVSSSGETTQAKTTGYNGQASFQVSNNSVWHVSASLAGYQSQSEVVTTSSAGPDVVRIELYRATVTTVPTGTVLPGELTPRPTQDPAGNPGTPGYTNAKGQEMMDWLAQNGMDLVQLCFMVTVLALLGVKLGK